MIVKVNIVRTEVLRSRKQFRIAGPAIFRPSLVSKRKYCNPLLSDNLLKISLFVTFLIPCNLALGRLGRGAIFSQRVNILNRCAAGISKVIVDSLCAFFGKRETDPIFIVFFCLSLVSGKSKLILRQKEIHLRGIHPKNRTVGIDNKVRISIYRLTFL